MFVWVQLTFVNTEELLLIIKWTQISHLLKDEQKFDIFHKLHIGKKDATLNLLETIKINRLKDFVNLLKKSSRFLISATCKSV